MGIRIVQSIIDLIRGKKTLECELLEITWLRKVLGSYSQDGEDLVISRLLKRRNRNLFYVDIGAHHPEKFSNTKYFYDKGSRGINIEANPDLIKEFYVQRKEDINLNIGIASEETELPFYVLDDNKLVSTFKKDCAQESCKDYNTTITKILQIKTYPLVKILNEYANGKVIDFMTVDVEGFDMDVLKSNDWTKYRPRFVIAETHHDTEIISFMQANGYKVVYKNYLNHIFMDKLIVKTKSKQAK